jgi:hypothetical protein
VTKRVALVVVAFLLLAASCGGGKAASTASPATTGPSRTTPADGRANEPVPGDYVYDLSGRKGTQAPTGTEITETISAEGKIFNSDIRNNRVSSEVKLVRRWENDGIYLTSTVQTVNGQSRTCTFTHPIKLIPLPFKAGKLAEQKTTDRGCEGVHNIDVQERTTTADATGRKWTVWKIVESEANLQGIELDQQTHFFSPDLGVDVRTWSDSKASSSQSLLKTYP